MAWPTTAATHPAATTPVTSAVRRTVVRRGAARQYPKTAAVSPSVISVWRTLPTWLLMLLPRNGSPAVAFRTL